MKVLENLKRTMESIDALKAPKNEEDNEFAVLFDKYKDIPVDTLKEIIADVKEAVKPEEKLIKEADNETNVIPAEGKPVEEIHKTQTNELDASEDGVVEETPEDFYTEDEDVTDDELIISEEDEDEIPEETEEKREDEIKDAEEKDDNFDEYEDELDIVEPDEEKEDKEDKDKVVNENVEKIDTDIPSEDNGADAADTAAKEVVNEANTAAKAAIANRDNKGSFSSDVDALTEYLDKI